MKKILLTIFFSFFFILPAHAEYSAGNDYDSVNGFFGNYLKQSIYGGVAVLQYFSISDTNISSLDLYIEGDLEYDATLYICKGPYDATETLQTNARCQGASQTKYLEVMYTAFASGSGWHTFDFTDFAVIPASNYFFAFEHIDTNGTELAWWTDDSAYDGYFYKKNAGDLYATLSTEWDLSFRINYNPDFVEPEVIIVDIYGYGLEVSYPYTDEYPFFSLEEETDFKIIYSLPDMASTSEYSFRYWYSATSTYATTTLLYTELISILDPDSDGFFTYTMSTTTQYGQFQLLKNSVNDVKAYQDVFINVVTEQIPPEDYNYFIKLFRSLFVPRASFVSDKISGLQSKIIYKPPIGYFTLIKTEFEDYSISSTSYPLEESYFPDIIKVFMRNILTSLLVTLFIIYIIYRVKHIDL